MDYRKLLYPFSVLYGGITALRNLAYDKGWKESKEYEIPVISVGNLSVGGTGKSPMVEWLVQLLKEDYRVAVLSRGYGRKTKGFLEVTVDATPEEVGDEPLQIKRKFPGITVVVCADRQTGIARLQGKAEVILLDDAFQHRKVKPALSILLTSYDRLFMDDLVLPAGNLREAPIGYLRADIVVVTKCPSHVPYAKLQEVQFRMNLQPHQSIYFSKIGYSETIFGKSETLSLDYLSGKPFTLVTGIAKPAPLVAYLKSKNFEFIHLKYPDHHRFSDKEIQELREIDLLLTTEKDFQRLEHRLEKKALYYLPIRTEYLYERENAFKKEVLNFLEYYRKH